MEDILLGKNTKIRMKTMEFKWNDSVSDDRTATENLIDVVDYDYFKMKFIMQTVKVTSGSNHNWKVREIDYNLLSEKMEFITLVHKMLEICKEIKVTIEELKEQKAMRSDWLRQVLGKHFDAYFLRGEGLLDYKRGLRFGNPINLAKMKLLWMIFSGVGNEWSMEAVVEHGNTEVDIDLYGRLHDARLTPLDILEYRRTIDENDEDLKRELDLGLVIEEMERSREANRKIMRALEDDYE